MTEPRDLHDITAGHFGTTIAELIATGTATSGFVPTSTGPGLQPVWAAGTGGGGSCDHQHATDTFTAAGATPETFTLAGDPLWDRRVHVNGLRVTPSAVGGTGSSVEVDTAADDEVVIDYEVECQTGCVGAAVQDGHPDTFDSLEWYYVSSAAAFAAQTPGPWVEDTVNPTGTIISESGKLFAQYPDYSRLTGALVDKPDFASVAEGDFVADQDGYWQRLPDTFDVTDTLDGWAANTLFTYGFGDDVMFILGGGNVYCGEVIDELTGDTEPVWTTAAGLDSFYIDFGDLYLTWPYVPGSVTGTLNAVAIDPGDLDESNPAEGIVFFTGSASGEDVIAISYTAVCP